MTLRRGFPIALIAVSILFGPRISSAGQANVINGSVAVQALSYVAYPVHVDAGLMGDATITGHLEASGGAGNDIEVMVIGESDFINWKNSHSASALYNSGRVTAADIHARVASSGTYYVVISNLFSAFTPKTVTGSVQIGWSPIPALLLSQSSGNAASVLTLFLAICFILLAVLLFGLWLGRRKPAQVAASEKKAA